MAGQAKTNFSLKEKVRFSSFCVICDYRCLEGTCTKEEAFEKFNALVKKQSHELNQLKTISKWRTVRLYNSFGEQILQES